MLNVEVFRKELMEAMRNREQYKKECLQMVISSIRNKEIEIKKTLNQDDIIKIIHKEIKQLKESISMSGNRDTSIYENKIEYLQKFLPEQLSEDEIMDIIKKMCSGINDKGKIMKTIIPVLHGRADNITVVSVVNKFLKN